MSFFRRDDEPAAAPQPARRTATPTTPSTPADQPITRIASGTRVTGEISGSTELLIEGEVDGRIRLDGRAVIGQGGGVKGEIDARSVLVAGRVEGPVRGSERVEVGASGRLEGDIAAPRVTIAEGAFFKGKVEMGGRDEKRASATPAGPPARDDRASGHREPGAGRPADRGDETAGSGQGDLGLSGTPRPEDPGGASGRGGKP